MGKAAHSMTQLFPRRTAGCDPQHNSWRAAHSWPLQHVACTPTTLRDSTLSPGNPPGRRPAARCPALPPSLHRLPRAQQGCTCRRRKGATQRPWAAGWACPLPPAPPLLPLALPFLKQLSGLPAWVQPLLLPAWRGGAAVWPHRRRCCAVPDARPWAALAWLRSWSWRCYLPCCTASFFFGDYCQLRCCCTTATSKPHGCSLLGGHLPLPPLLLSNLPLQLALQVVAANVVNHLPVGAGAEGQQAARHGQVGPERAGLAERRRGARHAMLSRWSVGRAARWGFRFELRRTLRPRNAAATQRTAAGGRPAGALWPTDGLAGWCNTWDRHLDSAQHQ